MKGLGWLWGGGGHGRVKRLRETYENRQTKSSTVNVFTSVFANVYRRIYQKVEIQFLYDFFVISLILIQNIRLGVITIQPINDFRNKCIVPINLESFRTPSLTSHTLPNSRLSIFFFQNSLFGTTILSIF